METEDTIWNWMSEQFGESGMTDRYMLSRAKVELEEALDSVEENRPFQTALEVIDVIIVLMGILGKYGYHMHNLVDQKMNVNRHRKWEYRDGRWQHCGESDD